MTTSGDIAKGILIFFIAGYLYTAILQASNGQTGIAAIMLVGFLVPLSIVLHGHFKDKKQANPLKH